jgi:hypothetical protein
MSVSHIMQAASGLFNRRCVGGKEKMNGVVT